MSMSLTKRIMFGAAGAGLVGGGAMLATSGSSPQIHAKSVALSAPAAAGGYTMYVAGTATCGGLHAQTVTLSTPYETKTAGVSPLSGSYSVALTQEPGQDSIPVTATVSCLGFGAYTRSFPVDAAPGMTYTEDFSG